MSSSTQSTQKESNPPVNEDNITVDSIDVPPKALHPFNIHILAPLAPFTIFGVLARLGLEALNTYDGQSIFTLAWVQGLGCLVMGFTLHFKDPLGIIYPPLYTAITTGFCGSLTTFSSWQLDVFGSWINETNAHRAGMRDFMDGLSKSIYTIGISLVSVKFGSHLASLIQPFLPSTKVFRFVKRTPEAIYTITAVSILTYLATLPTYFLMSHSFRSQATSALLFGYPGTLTRYFLAILINTRFPSFPLGTFIANMFGTALLAALHTVQHTSKPSSLACDIVQGLSDGYCGCLTTISTFSVELLSLGRSNRRERDRWLYGGASWVGGQILVTLVYGVCLWTGVAEKQRQCVFE